MWPFPDSEDTGVFTTRGILEEDLPILLVTHDGNDGAWQFMCGTTNEPSEGRLVHLRHIVERDPSVAELADLAPGWRATREGLNDPWKRYHDHSGEDWESADEQQVIDDVERVGWHCVGVEPTADDPPDAYPFAYTVGLEKTFDHAELVVLGLPFDVAWGFLNAAVDEIRAGTHFEAGQSSGSLIEDGALVAFREVARDRRLDHLTYADWFYERKGFAALQLVWPDSQGNLPEDADYPKGNPDQVLRDQPNGA